MSQRILGIDLGTFAVKTILLERRFQDFEVLSFAQQSLHQHTRLSHVESVVLALEQIFQNNPDMLSPDIVSAALPGHFISTRLLEMPPVPLKRLGQMVEFELEGHIPGETSALVVDAHVLDRSTDLSKVLTVCFREEILAEYLEALSRAHVDPKYFGSDLVDLSALPLVSMFPRDGHYAICDIGHFKTNVCLMQGSQLRYARTIGVGGLHFTKAIQRSYNLNFEKAEALKISRGKIHLRDKEADQISRTLTEVARELVSNIKQTFIGFDSFFGKENKTAVYVTGGGMRLSGLMDYLSFHLRANVLEIDPLNLVPHRLDAAEEHSHEMAQVFATAVRPIFSNRLPRVNFRKGAYAFKQDIQLITQELKHVAVFVVAILLLGVGYYFYADYHYTNKMGILERKIQRLIREEFPEFNAGKPATGKDAAGKTLDRYLKSAKGKLDTIRSQVSGITGGGLTPLSIMEEISQNLPSKTDVVFEVAEFNYSEEFIRLKARTNDPRNPAKIVEALDKSKFFSRIETTDPQQKPNDVYDFILKIYPVKEGE